LVADTALSPVVDRLDRADAAQIGARRRLLSPPQPGERGWTSAPCDMEA